MELKECPRKLAIKIRSALGKSNVLTSLYTGLKYRKAMLTKGKLL